MNNVKVTKFAVVETIVSEYCADTDTEINHLGVSVWNVYERVRCEYRLGQVPDRVLASLSAAERAICGH